MKEEKAKQLGQELDPMVRVGRKGITTSIIEEIDRQLEDKDLVKVKVLKNDPLQDIEKSAEILEEMTHGRIIEIRGKTILLYYEG